MRKHYYFVRGVVKYKNIQGEDVSEETKATYEVIQEKEDEEGDRSFFLNLILQLQDNLRCSFLAHYKYMNEFDITSAEVHWLCKLDS